MDKVFNTRKSVIIITKEPIPASLQRLSKTVIDLAIVPSNRVEEIFQFWEQQQYPVDIVIIEAAEIIDGRIKISNNFEELIERIKSTLTTSMVHLIGLFNGHEEHDYSTPPGTRCCYSEDDLPYLLQEMRIVSSYFD